MSSISDADKSLFEQAVKDVQKLKTSKAYSPNAAGHLRPCKRTKTSHHPSHHLDNQTSFSMKHQAWENPTQSVSAFETLEYRQPDCSAQDFKRLKKGHFSTVFELDLHGLTEVQADQALTRFLQEAIAYKTRYLIIVHGKGYNSESKQPVLKNLVNCRLPQWSQVLAFCSAQPKHGGTGAVYVFLKKQGTASGTDE